MCSNSRNKGAICVRPELAMALFRVALPSGSEAEKLGLMPLHNLAMQLDSADLTSILKSSHLFSQSLYEVTISVLLFVMKAENCCRLPLKSTEEDHLEEAAASQAAAKEISVNGAKSGGSLRNACHCCIRRREKRGTEGFSEWKICFCFLTDRLAVHVTVAAGQRQTLGVILCTNRKPRAAANWLSFERKADKWFFQQLSKVFLKGTALSKHFLWALPQMDTFFWFVRFATPYSRNFCLVAPVLEAGQNGRFLCSLT